MIRLSFWPPVVLLMLGTFIGAQAAGPVKSDLTGASNTSLLYVGLFNGQTVNVYRVPQNEGPIQQILDGVSNITGDLAVDKSQRLYATSNAVMVYPRGGLVPALRYNFADQHQPPLVAGTAIGSDGTLYTAMYGDGLVAAYLRGTQQRASLTIPTPSGTTAWAVAVDAQDNVYIEYAAAPYPSTGHIEKCAPGSTQCTDLGITLNAAGNHLAVDLQGNLIACDQLAAKIEIFPPGSNQPRVISQGLVGCPNFALNASEDLLYVANQPHDGNNHGVSIFDYASGALVGSITAGIPSDDLIIGVALSPVAH